MPELPEVETVRRGLEPLLKGQRIAKVELRRAGLRRPFAADFARRLGGARITGLRRRAKYILIDLEGGPENRDVWLVHLGMSGSFRSVAEGAGFKPETHDHVVVTLGDGTMLAFNDPRRFGQMEVFAATQEASQPGLAQLGPEPLDAGFDGDALRARLRGRKTPIKVALLDQRVVAGVGNIYACEALFRSGISPRRQAGALGKNETGVLAQAIRDVLGAALKSGGSTLRNHRQIDGNLGYFQHQFAVYGHEGEACPGCTCAGKKRIDAITQAGRTTFYCPVKQR